MVSNVNEAPLKVYRLPPDDWKPNKIRYSASDLEELRADGWRLIVEPTLLANQKKGALIYDAVADRVTYEVIDLSPEEIAQREEEALDRDTSASALDRDTEIGRRAFKRFLAFIRRLFDEGKLTGAQARNAARLLYFPLLPLKDGQFIIAKDSLDALTPPANPKELAVLNKAKEVVAGLLTL